MLNPLFTHKDYFRPTKNVYAIKDHITVFCECKVTCSTLLKSKIYYSSSKILTRNFMPQNLLWMKLKAPRHNSVEIFHPAVSQNKKSFCCVRQSIVRFEVDRRIFTIDQMSPIHRNPQRFWLVPGRREKGTGGGGSSSAAGIAWKTSYGWSQEILRRPFHV